MFLLPGGARAAEVQKLRAEEPHPLRSVFNAGLYVGGGANIGGDHYSLAGLRSGFPDAPGSLFLQFLDLPFILYDFGVIRTDYDLSLHPVDDEGVAAPYPVAKIARPYNGGQSHGPGENGAVGGGPARLQGESPNPGRVYPYRVGGTEIRGYEDGPGRENPDPRSLRVRQVREEAASHVPNVDGAFPEYGIVVHTLEELRDLADDGGNGGLRARLTRG